MKNGRYACGILMMMAVLAISPVGVLADERPQEEKAPTLEDRVKQLEEGLKAPTGPKWFDRIQVGGLVEIEAGYGEVDFDDPAEEDEKASDVDLATVELAIRYGGSDDGGGNFLPETQYGAVVNWGLLENTNIAFEYLHGEFEEDFQETDAVTAQLSIEIKRLAIHV